MACGTREPDAVRASSRELAVAAGALEHGQNQRRVDSYFLIFSCKRGKAGSRGRYFPLVQPETLGDSLFAWGRASFRCCST